MDYEVNVDVHRWTKGQLVEEKELISEGVNIKDWVKQNLLVDGKVKAELQAKEEADAKKKKKKKEAEQLAQEKADSEKLEAEKKALEESKKKEATKEEVNLDLNNDGVVDSKDASIAGKVMNQVKQNKSNKLKGD